MILNYIKLLRIPNLVFIACLQLLMHYCIAVPLAGVYGITPAMSLFRLILLIVATVFIAAGGYVINDYFDMRIDEINNPDTRIVGKNLSRKETLGFYTVISVIGVLAGMILCYFAHSLTYAFIFLIIVGLLWFYSSSYKRQLIVGNLVVSVLAAMVPFIVALFEMRFLLLECKASEELMLVCTSIIRWIGGFALFALIWTFIREIIKDIKDEEGDREMECHTIPVVLGIEKSKIIIYLLIVIALGLGFYFVFGIIPLKGSLSWRYFLSGIVIPAIVLLYLIYKAKDKDDYRLSAQVVKAIMIIGTLYSLLVWYLL